MPTILFVGGGSVGHIAPSVAVWNECNQLQSGLTAHFVCSPRQDDAAFLQENTCNFTVLNAPRLSLAFPLTFAKSVKEVKQLFDDIQPDVVFSKGGYVSLPVCYVAHQRKIPIVLHESDSVSGYANRIVGMWAKEICTGFPSRHTHTGNPVRTQMTKGSKEKGLKQSGLVGDRPVLLVMGGSQGAQAINEAVSSMLGDLLLRCDVLHITGRGKRVPDDREGYFQTEFAGEELADYYAAADIAVSRAGAGSIAELAANGIPTVLVPLRDVGHDHQFTNAQAAAKTGGCIHIEQVALKKMLLPTIHKLCIESDYRKEISKKIRTLSNPDAALQIAKILLQALDNTARDQ